jgi:hypothetical protein
MTVLPGGETSATALLEQAIRTPGNPLHDFDWIALVEEALPGQKTDHQREQTARMARLQTDLRTWAAEEGLPEDHIEASAIYAVGSTPADWPWEVTRGLARLIWWGYTFDAFIDQPALRDTIKDLSTLNHYIDAVSHGLSIHSPPRQSDLPQACIALRAALAHFVADLPTFWGKGPGFRKQRYRHHHFLKELAAWIGTMAQESRWDFHLARRQKMTDLPSVAAYVRNGKRSIGVYAVAAFAAGLEDDPRRAWHRGLSAIEAGGRVARITNDIHLFERDTSEQHVTLVTLILRDLRFPLTSLKGTPEMQQALSESCHHLDRAVMDFGAHCAHAGTGSLSYVLQHVVALALGIYGNGDRYRE